MLGVNLYLGKLGGEVTRSNNIKELYLEPGSSTLRRQRKSKKCVVINMLCVSIQIFVCFAI